MSREDDMVSTLITHYKNDGHDELEYEFEPEAHYNYYGDRGVADLYITEIEHLSDGREYRSGHVFEIKSAQAVRDATGANEILRQFHRMRKYFFRDESRPQPYKARFELCFTISKETVSHVAENLELYRSSQNQKLSPTDSFSSEAGVLFRKTDPSDITPAHTKIPIDNKNPTDAASWLDALYETHITDEATKELESILEEIVAEDGGDA